LKNASALCASAANRKTKGLKPFIFRSLFKCGECGRQITAETKVKPSGKTYTYYRCTKKNRVCSQKYIEEKDLIGQINKLLKKFRLTKQRKITFSNNGEKIIKKFPPTATLAPKI